MGAPKLKKDAFKDASGKGMKSSDPKRDKQEIELYKSKIADLVKDEENAKKAAMILHMMLNKSNKKKP
jgi:hypothetical protein